MPFRRPHPARIASQVELVEQPGGPPRPRRPCARSRAGPAPHRWSGRTPPPSGLGCPRVGGRRGRSCRPPPAPAERRAAAEVVAGRGPGRRAGPGVRERSAASRASGSSCCRTRRIVDACGAAAPTCNASSTSRRLSWAYSEIAAYDRAPASTAHALISSTDNTPWRTPRAVRGSGTCANAATSDNLAGWSSGRPG